MHSLTSDLFNQLGRSCPIAPLPFQPVEPENHYSLRRAFPTVRKSIAVLAGNWSAPSKALMESFDVSLFEVSFTKIVDTLAEYGVDILWGEKETERVKQAWNNWSQLSETQYLELARKLLSDIEPELRESMKVTLDTAVPREVSEVEVTIETNLGESRRYTFDSIEAAIEFLNDFDEQEVLNDENGPSIFEPTPVPPSEGMATLWSLEEAGNYSEEDDDDGEGV